MKKIYNPLTSLKKALLATAMLASGFGLAQATYTMNYTGSVQTLTLGPGSYSIQAWGANGADGTYYSSMTPNNNISGGKGGYSTGTFSTATTTTLYIYVGGKGTNTLSGNNPGGYNGGGNSSSAPYAAGSGGGASHIAMVSGLLNTLSSNTAAVRIVAGGGGGGGNQSLGGDGGGLNGIQPPTSTQFSNRTAGGGGSQTAGGVCFTSGSGAGFGQGGTTTQNLAGGGGGGWYGGCTGDNSTAGGGGSGYVGGVNNGTTVAQGSAGFIANPVTTGNGLIIIKELCNITLVPSTSNTLTPSICSGQSVTLTTNAVSNYSWSTGATTSSIVVSPNTSTVYALTATSPSNCSASANVSITVSTGQPTLSVSSTNSVCFGKTTSLTASGALTYTWSNNVTNGVTFTPTVTTTYTVQGQNGCGTATTVATISVAPLPVGIFASTNTVCIGSPATFTVVSAATVYSWTPTNYSTNSTSYIVSPTVATVYTVSASDGTCSGTGTVAVGVNPIPTIGISVNNTTPCIGAVISASATGGNSYTWMPINVTGQTATLAPQSPTLLTVTGNNQFGCTSSAQQIILVQAIPQLSVDITNTLICKGASVVLTAGGTAASYTWTGNSAGASNTVTPNAITVYTVTGTHPTNGCTTTATSTVDVVVTSVSVTGPTAVCPNGSATLTASGADSYQWVNGGPFATNVVSPTVATIYTVTGTTNTLGLMCNANATVQVGIYANPTITATSTRSVMCKNETQTLNASGAVTYTWNNGSSTTGSSISINPKFTGSQVFTITGTSADNCTAKTTLTVSVQACTGVEGNTAALFNIYPNPSQGNLTVDGIENGNVKIYNQNGQLVFEGKITSQTNTLDLSHLAKGLYQVNLQQGSQVVVKKIVIE
jgi:hypothetical protein